MSSIPGSYQQYVVSPARYTSPIPDGVDDFIAGPIMCSASTIYRSLVESGLQPGEWAVFPGGGGGVGIQGVQLAKAMGLRPIVIDTGASKRELCMKMGAEAFVDFKESEDVAKEVVSIADGVGAHGIFVTAPSAYNTAIGLVGDRIGGKVMCIGLRTCFLSIPANRCFRSKHSLPNSTSKYHRLRHGPILLLPQKPHRQRHPGRQHEGHGSRAGLREKGLVEADLHRLSDRSVA